MPFKTFVNGQKLLALLMTDDEWEALRQSVKKGESIIKMLCGYKGFQRICMLGTKHFYHEDNVSYESHI